MEGRDSRPLELVVPAEQPRAPVPSETAPQRTDEAAAPPRRPPPRLVKPSEGGGDYFYPTTDFEAHRAELREALGNTMSDEFVDAMLGKLCAVLRPSCLGPVDEATLNAGIALVCSLEPRSAYEAFLAVQAVGVGFSALQFLQMSTRHYTEEYIAVWGAHALKLFKAQNDLIRAYNRHRAGNCQTVEVRHVHIYSGGQGVVGIVNTGSKGALPQRNEGPPERNEADRPDQPRMITAKAQFSAAEAPVAEVEGPPHERGGRSRRRGGELGGWVDASTSHADYAADHTQSINRDIRMTTSHARNTGPMLASKRCGARTRSGTPCGSPAVAGKQRCRMHGGAAGSGAPTGNHNALKHGMYTILAKTELNHSRALLREARKLLEGTG